MRRLIFVGITLHSFLSFCSTAFSKAQSGLISQFKRNLCVPQVLRQPLSAITSVCSSNHRASPLVRWMNVTKDVLDEFHWLFELQSRGSHEWYQSIRRKADREKRKKVLVYTVINKNATHIIPSLEIQLLGNNY